MHRFFVDRLTAGQVDLPMAEAHHALNVLRLGVGQTIELLDGAGGRAIAQVVLAKKGQVVADVGQVERMGDRPRPVVHLAFAVPKGKRLDWLLEKATELGAASLQAVVFDRSVAGGDELSDNKKQRWLGHCISAAKQSGTAWLPEIRPTASLADWVAQGIPDGGMGLYGDLAQGCKTLGMALSQRPVDKSVTILIGPEGGLTDGEREALGCAKFHAVRLGTNILRIETAALALLAATAAICQTDGDNVKPF